MLAHTVWGSAREAALGLELAVRLAPGDPGGARALAYATFLWDQRPRTPEAAHLVKEVLCAGIRGAGQEGACTAQLLAKLAQVIVTPPSQEWTIAEALAGRAHSLRQHDPEIQALLHTIQQHPCSMAYALTKMEEAGEEEEDDDDDDGGGEASSVADPNEPTIWENEDYEIKRSQKPRKRNKQQEKRYREMMKKLDEVEKTWNLELKNFWDDGNDAGPAHEASSVETRSESVVEAKKKGTSKRRGVAGDNPSEYWHRFCYDRREEARSKMRQKQKDAINQYVYDYPWVPEEERGWVDNVTLVVRRFNGEGEVPPVFLDSETRSTMSQLDVERIRLTGRPVQVVDHEETELAKQLSRLNGEVRYVDTAQGFRLTEDEFNFKVPWNMEGEEAKEMWDQIPVVSEIAEQLQQQNKTLSWKAVSDEIEKRLPENFAEDLPLDRTFQEALFEPATPVPGYCVLQPREILEPYGELDDLYQWKEKDEQVGKIWKEKMKSMEEAGDFDEMSEEESEETVQSEEDDDAETVQSEQDDDAETVQSEQDDDDGNVLSEEGSAEENS